MYEEKGHSRQCLTQYQTQKSQFYELVTPEW